MHRCSLWQGTGKERKGVHGLPASWLDRHAVVADCTAPTFMCDTACLQAYMHASDSPALQRQVNQAPETRWSSKVWRHVHFGTTATANSGLGAARLPVEVGSDGLLHLCWTSYQLPAWASARPHRRASRPAHRRAAHVRGPQPLQMHPRQPQPPLSRHQARCRGWCAFPS